MYKTIGLVFPSYRYVVVDEYSPLYDTSQAFTTEFITDCEDINPPITALLPNTVSVISVFTLFIGSHPLELAVEDVGALPAAMVVP